MVVQAWKRRKALFCGGGGALEIVGSVVSGSVVLVEVVKLGRNGVDKRKKIRKVYCFVVI